MVTKVWRRISRIGAVVVLATGLMAVESNDVASARTVCHTFTQERGLTDGSPKIKVGYTYFHLSVCTNRTSMWSSATTSRGETGPGNFNGFRISLQQPVRTSFDSGGLRHGGHAYYKATGYVKACAVKYTFFCSRTDNYAEYYQVHMYRYPYDPPVPSGVGFGATNPPGKYTFRMNGRAFYVHFSHTADPSDGVGFH